MKRLTTDNPKDDIENALNLFYAKDQWAWVRGGGPAPDYADISLCDFVRMLAKANIPDAELPEDDDDLSMMMAEWLIDDPASAEGIISLLYTAGWAFAELRHRLAHYEDMEEQGRLVVLPCKVGSVVYAAETTPVIPLHVIAPAVYLDGAEGGDFEMLDNFGKTVFLTREEAERALEGGVDHE
jgi:hypothetical protein